MCNNTTHCRCRLASVEPYYRFTVLVTQSFIHSLCVRICLGNSQYRPCNVNTCIRHCREGYQGSVALSCPNLLQHNL